jgi:hypothetical protein
MKLEIVRERRRQPTERTDDAQEAADMAAVLAVLAEAVDKTHIPASTYRRVLRFVLPIHDTYRGTKLTARRKVAGEKIFDDDRVLTSGTIRTSYEPLALDWLGVTLVKLEAEHRGERPPKNGLPNLTPS